MLVDDSEIVRKGLHQALEHSDDFMVVGQTGEGEEALGLAERLRPDVILMDVLMPGKNGIDACREITTALPGAKVLMLTAFSDGNAVNKALAAGATGYLPKLWGRGQLLNALRAVVEGRYRSSTPSAVRRGESGCPGSPEGEDAWPRP